MWVTVIYLFGVFVLLVAVHELGHLWAARQFKMKIEEFAIGIGPVLARLWRGRDGTTYTIRALPLGGFVKIAGMVPQEQHREDGFLSKPLYARALTILAGPIASLLFGFILLSIVGAGAGLPSPQNPTLQVRFVSPSTPAHQAGVCIGDTLLKVGNLTVGNLEEFEQAIAAYAGQTTTLLLRRDHQQITLKLAVPPNISRSGKISQTLGFVWLHEREHFDPATVASNAALTTVAVPVGVWQGVFWIFTGKGDFQNMGSLISIASLIEATAQLGFWETLEFAAMFSLMLGAINLLPIPVLDGGYLLIFLIEAIRRRRLSPEAFAWIQFLGMLIVMAMCLGAISLDIYRLCTGTLIR
ncbi:MAG: M50 family metallopeptidase [Fimbriimonadales bacterium]|nr:M50 family metallopeptidase [Fimbriimonadales bacterium]